MDTFDCRIIFRDWLKKMELMTWIKWTIGVHKIMDEIIWVLELVIQCFVKSGMKDEIKMMGITFNRLMRREIILRTDTK